MKRMTQVLAILLAMVLLLTACNTQKPVQTQPKETQGSQKPVETQPKETEEVLDLSDVVIDAFVVKGWVATGMPANEDDVIAEGFFKMLNFDHFSQTSFLKRPQGE